jgi:glutathione peroxidase
MQSVYDFSAESITGQVVDFSSYRGRVLLIVNVASRCAFTPQYAQLEELYQKYRDRGFVVLGFPSGQFMNQELETGEEIQEFCSTRYNVTFPVFSKINVNGSAAHPLYKYLTSQAAGWLGIRRIGWNFSKFLVDRNGRVFKRYSTMATPKSIEDDIKKLLAA